MVTLMTSLLVLLNYQRDELGDISPFARDGLALGFGAQFFAPINLVDIEASI